MNNTNGLSRFIDAQAKDYQKAAGEVVNGRKQSHWMWYIFPQIQGLGFSETSRYYAIRDLKEAQDFFQHPVLGERLVNICQKLLESQHDDANKIFGSPDDMKLKSSITLFSSLEHSHPVFQSVLEKFFGGEKDKKTLQIIGS